MDSWICGTKRIIQKGGGGGTGSYFPLADGRALEAKLTEVDVRSKANATAISDIKSLKHRTEKATYDTVNKRIVMILKGLHLLPFRISFEAYMKDNGVDRVMNIENMCHLRQGLTQERWVTQEKHDLVSNAGLGVNAKILTYKKLNDTDTEIAIEGISSSITEISLPSCIIEEIDAELAD